MIQSEINISHQAWRDKRPKRLMQIQKTQTIQFTHDKLLFIPSSGRSETYSNRSCQKKNSKRHMMWSTRLERCRLLLNANCSVEQRRMRAAARRAMRYWPHLTPAPLCTAPCRHLPRSRLNPDPPVASALSICKWLRWNKVVWQIRVKCICCVNLFSNRRVKGSLLEICLLDWEAVFSDDQYSSSHCYHRD